jgi:hypothetical protein
MDPRTSTATATITATEGVCGMMRTHSSAALNLVFDVRVRPAQAQCWQCPAAARR